MALRQGAHLPARRCSLEAGIADLAFSTEDVHTFRRGLFDCLRRTVPYDRIFMHATNGYAAGHVTAIGWYADDVGVSLCRYISQMHDAELAIPFRTTCHMETVFEPSRQQELAIFREQAIPHGIVSTLWRMWGCPTGVSSLVLGRQRPASSIHRDLWRLERLIPVIRASEALLLSVAFARSRHDQQSERYHLTKQERAVVALVVRGLGNSEIAGLLGISPNTVRNQMASIFTKVAVSTRSELVFVMTSEEESRTHVWSVPQLRRLLERRPPRPGLP
jgi:DNA-binding CsgD family transcriptional regulator